MAQSTLTKSHEVAFLDIGTNSVRMLLARINPNHSYSVLTQQREVVRLGGGEFPRRRLLASAIDRAVLVCTKFAQMARSCGAEEILAVATSACREADNKSKLLRRLRKEAGIDVRVISGKEEARLIHLGVSTGLHLGGQRSLFIDIGGGSTEIIIGDGKQHQYLDSLKLGAIRLTNLFFARDFQGPVSRAQYKLIQREVSNAAVLTVGHARKIGFERAVGSSGTIMNLGEIAMRKFFGRPLQRDDVLKHSQLRQVIRMLCGMDLAQRRKVPGINPERADILIAGGAIIDTLMAELKLSGILVSDRGLRDGLLVDYLARHERAAELLERMSVRQRSVLLLGRACGFDEPHANQVARLCDELFDTSRQAGLHRMTDADAELLHHAATLHDIGVFLSFVNHQNHTFYLIRNSDLLGFDEQEIAVMAAVARFHRKGFPGGGGRYPELADLDKAARKTVCRLSALLRLAESLDRSHSALVEHVGLSAPDKRIAELAIECSPRGCELELWGVLNHRKFFRKAFGRDLEIRQK